MFLVDKWIDLKDEITIDATNSFINAISQCTKTIPLIDLSYGLRSLTKNKACVRQKIYEWGAMGGILQLLSHDEIKIVQNILIIVKELVKDERKYLIKTVVENGFLTRCKPWLQHENTSIRSATWYLLSIISADCLDFATAIIESGVLESLLYIIENDVYSVKEQATFVISNIFAFKSLQILQFYYENRVLETLVNCLCDKSYNTQAILRILKGITISLQSYKEEGIEDCENHMKNLLLGSDSSSPALDRLEELQDHESTYIYSAWYDIISTYFEEEDIEDEIGEDVDMEDEEECVLLIF